MKRLKVFVVLATLAVFATAVWAGDTTLHKVKVAAGTFASRDVQSAFGTPANRQGALTRTEALARAKKTHPARGSKAVLWKKSATLLSPGTGLSLTVTNTNDSGPGSLRDAIDQANGTSGSTITFNLSYPATITLNCPLFVESDMTIQGPGADKLTVSGDCENQVFNVGEACATISGLTVADGYSEGQGGGISNCGILTLKGCQVSGCYASCSGGGIVSYYKLIIMDSSITCNGTDESGGGIEDYGCSLHLINSTVSNNTACGDGGGISLDDLFAGFTNVTVAGNYSGGLGGGVYGDGDESCYTLLNTILAYNCAYCYGQDWFGYFDSEGHNLVDFAYDIFDIYGPATDDIYNVNAMIAPPAPNGGPTMTDALLLGSPAYDAGDDSVLGDPLDLTTDQRGTGFPRKVGAHVDIGAFESGLFVGFVDDTPTSEACVNAATGAFNWQVVGGPSFCGSLNVYNGGTMFWSKPGASQYVYIYYDPNGHTAWGYLYDYTTGLYSSLFDSNTLNDETGCAFLQEGPPVG